MPVTNKRVISIIIFILIITAVLAAILAFPRQTPPFGENGSSDSSTTFAKGLSLSPKSYNSSDFTDFFLKAKQAGTIVSWAGDWSDLSNKNGGASVVASLSSTYGYDAAIELQFFQQSNGALLRPLDNATMQTYKNSAVSFAEKYKPEYLALGIEINILFEKSPTDFDTFTNFYKDVYDGVKAQSPETKIFPIFQLETMKGLNGGLFGGVNDQSKSEWALLDRFPKMDLVAFTTYPRLIYKNPIEIPAGYYSEIQQHTSKPVAFMEIGWHSNANPAGWESSNTKQAQFVTVFFNLTKGLNKEIAIWSFLYDQNITEPFNSMGLWTVNDEAKPAWNTWINVK